MTALNSQGWAYCTQEGLTRCQQERIFGLQDYKSADDLKNTFYMIGDKNVQSSRVWGEIQPFLVMVFVKT